MQTVKRWQQISRGKGSPYTWSQILSEESSPRNGLVHTNNRLTRMMIFSTQWTCTHKQHQAYIWFSPHNGLIHTNNSRPTHEGVKDDEHSKTAALSCMLQVEVPKLPQGWATLRKSEYVASEKFLSHLFIDLHTHTHTTENSFSYNIRHVN